MQTYDIEATMASDAYQQIIWPFLEKIKDLNLRDVIALNLNFAFGVLWELGYDLPEKRKSRASK